MFHHVHLTLLCLDEKQLWIGQGGASVRMQAWKGEENDEFPKQLLSLRSEKLNM